MFSILSEVRVSHISPHVNILCTNAVKLCTCILYIPELYTNSFTAGELWFDCYYHTIVATGSASGQNCSYATKSPSIHVGLSMPLNSCKCLCDILELMIVVFFSTFKFCTIIEEVQ